MTQSTYAGRASLAEVQTLLLFEQSQAEQGDCKQ